MERIHNEAVKRFEKEGYPVEWHEKSLSSEKLVEKINSASILGIRSRTLIDGKILSQAKRLLTIGVYGIGINHVDLEISSKKGISVFNAPYSNTRSVVELVIGEIIILIRSIPDKNTKLHKGIWDKSAANSHEIRGKTLGIVGYGNIGSQLSVLAESLGMKICFYDIVDKLALGNAKKCRSLNELLSKSDVITLHVDGNPRNKNLIDEKGFSLMKDGAVFLNSSRGSVVNLQALASSIRKGKIHGAAIDVFPEEPKGNDEQFVSELQNLPNVILTPHIGGSTEEAQRNIGEFKRFNI
jgi:D-3-phosphoglycerate dehydrogenase